MGRRKGASGPGTPVVEPPEGLTSPGGAQAPSPIPGESKRQEQGGRKGVETTVLEGQEEGKRKRKREGQEQVKTGAATQEEYAVYQAYQKLCVAERAGNDNAVQAGIHLARLCLREPGALGQVAQKILDDVPSANIGE